jgi:hypothetical protein
MRTNLRRFLEKIFVRYYGNDLKRIVTFAEMYFFLYKFELLAYFQNVIFPETVLWLAQLQSIENLNFCNTENSAGAGKLSKVFFPWPYQGHAFCQQV